MILRAAGKTVLKEKILNVNNRLYPMFCSWKDHDTWIVTTVLVAGGGGDYAAYSGVGEPAWVARFGGKITFEEACVHFPGLESEKYRR